jgi:glycosyltransferase involved in cell wall biosynthesis
MKPLFVIGSKLTGGVERITLDLLTELSRGGIDCSCLMFSWAGGEIEEKLSDLGIGYTKCKIGWFYLRKPLWTLANLLHLPAAWRGAKKIIESQPWTHLYITTYRQLLVLGALPSTMKVVYNVQDRVSTDRQFELLSVILRRRVWRFVAASKFIEEDLLAAGIPREEVVLVSNGTRIPPSFTPPPSNGTFTIGMVGQILPQKGQRELLEALSQLPATLDFRLRIAGQGDPAYEASLHEAVVALGLSQKVEFVGFLDIAKLYEDLNLVAVPSIYEEPFGLVSIEAQARGIPVVVSDAGGLPETVADGETGRVFARSKPGELREILEWFITHPAEARTMGERARRHVEANFSLDRTVSQLRDLLAEG